MLADNAEQLWHLFNTETQYYVYCLICLYLSLIGKRRNIYRNVLFNGTCNMIMLNSYDIFLTLKFNKHIL